MHPTETEYITEYITRKDHLLNNKSVLSLDASPDSNKVYFGNCSASLVKKNIEDSHNLLY